MNELVKLLLEKNIEMTIMKDIRPGEQYLRVMFSYAYHFAKRVIIDMDDIEAANVPIETVLYSHLLEFLRELEGDEPKEEIKRCASCKYNYADYDSSPCNVCFIGDRITHSEWQPKE